MKAQEREPRVRPGRLLPSLRRRPGRQLPPGARSRPVRAAEALLMGFGCYLAGAATSWAAHWCRRMHHRHHVPYSPEMPGARFCSLCGEYHDVSDVDWNPQLGCRRRYPSVPSLGGGPVSRR